MRRDTDEEVPMVSSSDSDTQNAQGKPWTLGVEQKYGVTVASARKKGWDIPKKWPSTFIKVDFYR